MERFFASIPACGVFSSSSVVLIFVINIPKYNEQQLEHFEQEFSAPAHRIYIRLHTFVDWCVSKTGIPPFDLEAVFGGFIKDWLYRLANEGAQVAKNLAANEKV